MSERIAYTHQIMTIVQRKQEMMQRIVMVGLHPERRDGLVLQEVLMEKEEQITSYGDLG
jgi:hypothetical protein